MTRAHRDWKDVLCYASGCFLQYTQVSDQPSLKIVILAVRNPSLNGKQPFPEKQAVWGHIVTTCDAGSVRAAVVTSKGKTTACVG